MGIQYTNNSVKVKNAMKQSVVNALTEIAGEIQQATYRNSRTDTGQTKGSYQFKVFNEGDSVTAVVGSDYQNAIWEEYGTGEYALAGNGRKTPWVYKDSKGKWHRTRGKTPNRPLFKAFTAYKGKIAERIKQALESNLGG